MNSGLQPVVVGAFDDVRSRQIRFLQEAARLGPLTVRLWSDALVEHQTGRPPKFPQAERAYLLRAIRFVDRVELVDRPDEAESLPPPTGHAGVCRVVEEAQDNGAKRENRAARGVHYHVIPEAALRGFPDVPPGASVAPRPKVLVTGCYDWLHSGHVRFFEEASAFGDLYVVVGDDANVRLLKGASHPLRGAAERRYNVSAIRFVTQAFISTGTGWLDAEPEVERLRPDLYVVNEDGDQGGKREFCAARGIEYRVLRRLPAPGLPRRTSTELRGF
jgi:cytidyltransferase-like protein